MGKKLYVGNIAFSVTEDELRELFAKLGEVESAKIITDPATGRSKGFGFVEMASDEDAKKAIEAINGSSFKERTLVVNEAKPMQPREGRGPGRDRGGFGGRGPGGGYGKGRR